MRLGMWQRAGIVASALWALGAAGWTYFSMGSHAATFATGFASSCEKLREDLQRSNVETAVKYGTPPPQLPDDHCWAGYSRDFDFAVNGRRDLMAVNAIAPVLLAWLLAWLGVVLTRWVLAGRRPANSD